jgi:hypothetical protein
MKMQRPMMVEEEHVVLEFRPRALAERPGRRVVTNSVELSSLHLPEDLSRYERPREEPDDFRHRMLANAAALAFTIALTAVGLWLAMSIANLRNIQDCVLIGRGDCAPIVTTHD